MKTFLFAVILFIIVLSLVVVNVLYLKKSISYFRTSISQIPFPDKNTENLTLQFTLLSELEKAWYHRIFLLSLSISHQDLMEVEQHLAAALGAAKANSRENYIVSISQLDYSFSHLGAMSRISFQNIF